MSKSIDAITMSTLTRTTTSCSTTHTVSSVTTYTETSTTNTLTRTNTVTYPPGSLFCFSLMLPGSYEQELLSMQHREQVSIFVCDQYAIYSRERIELAPGVNTIIINSDLKC